MNDVNPVSPSGQPLGPSRPSKDPSIEFEPHLNGRLAVPDASETKAEQRILRAAESQSEMEQVERSVWDEPALQAGVVAGAPEDAPTYARWLDRKIAETSLTASWATTLGIVIAAGPWGVLGAFMTQMAGAGAFAMAGAIILAPVTEEITKIAMVLWVVEKRPYLFRSTGQILLCAVAGGLAFALIENMIYLNVYIDHPGPAIKLWRWTVCTTLHLGCSFLAGIGLVRIWKTALDDRRRPELAHGMPWFAGAMILHGLYNAGVTLGEAFGLMSFE